MRLLYLLFAHLDGFHGASKHVLGLSGAVAEAGVPVRLLCASDKLNVQVPGRQTIDIAPKAQSGSSVARAMLMRVFRDSWLDRTDTVVYTRAHHLGAPAVLAAHIRRRPLVVELNGMPEFAAIEQSDSRRRAGLGQRLKMLASVAAMSVSYRSIMSRAAAIFVNNPEARSYLIQNRGLDSALVHVIPLGYDPRHARPLPLEECRTTLGLPASDRLVVHVGSLYPYKGADTLLDAFLRLRPANCRLVFVGGGPFRAALQHRAQESGFSDRVLLVGERPFAETAVWAGAADVAVGLSNIDLRWGCCPTKVIEYAACGVPVIANSMAITRELAREMPIALVEDARDIDSVARSLQGMLSAEPRRCRVQSLPSVVTQYAWPEIGRKAIDAMTSLCKDRNPSRISRKRRPISH